MPTRCSTLGSATDTWGNVWDPTQLANAEFRLELRNNDPGAACDSASTTSVSFLTVQVTYRTITDGTTNPPISTALCNTADFNFVIDMSGSIGPQGPAPSNLPQLKAGITDFVNTFQAAGGDGRYSGTRFNGSSASAITSGYEAAADFIDDGRRPQRAHRPHADRQWDHDRIGQQRGRPGRRPEHHVRPDGRLPEQAQHPRR